MAVSPRAVKRLQRVQAIAALWIAAVMAISSYGMVVSTTNLFLDQTLKGHARGLKFTAPVNEATTQASAFASIDHYRPRDTRVELFRDKVRIAAAGDGPALRILPSGTCASIGSWRACSEHREGTSLHFVVAGRHKWASGLFSLFGWMLVLIVGATVLLTRLFTGRLARRTLEEAVEREQRFAAQASHELRTPITVIQGELNELRLDVERSHVDPRTIIEGLTRVQASATQLARMTEALLLMNRSDRPFDLAKLELVNVADVVREQAAIAQRTHARSVSVAVQAEDEVLVRGHDALLARMVANLLENATKHGSGPITLSVLRSESSAVLTIEDCGSGIDVATRETLFEPFGRRLDAVRHLSSNGLGLATVRAIARAHGGEAELLPSNRGAHFEIRLPLASL